MLKPDYPIETERLLLRPLEAGDVEALHAYQSRPDVCRYIPYEPRSREAIAERLADPAKSRSTLEEPGQALDLAIVRKDTGQLIGDVLLFWHSEEHKGGEVGYALNPEHGGHGPEARARLARVRAAQRHRLLESRNQRQRDQKPGETDQVRPQADQVLVFPGKQDEDQQSGERRQ